MRLGCCPTNLLGWPGEVESKAKAWEFEDLALPEKTMQKLVEASNRQALSTEKQDSDPNKPKSEEYNQARDVANRIYSTAKAVLEQSHNEFLQLLTSIDRNKPAHDELCQVGPGNQPNETPSPASTTDAGTSADSEKQSDVSSTESKQWKRSVKTKKSTSRSSSLCFPVSPGLVTRASCCGTQEKLQEKRYQNSSGDDMETINKMDKTKLCFMDREDADTIKIKKVGGKARSVASSVASDESKRTGPKEGGRVRLRITPQHFSPLGTTFRDVHVEFLPMSFSIRALDSEGYAWTAHSNTLPGYLAVDRCKYKIDPSGKDVVISLLGADEDQSLKGMSRLELTRPYEFGFQEQGVEAESNSPISPKVMMPTKFNGAWVPTNLKSNFI